LQHFLEAITSDTKQGKQESNSKDATNRRQEKIEGKARA
jgi:hypothetical protein